MSDPSLFKWRHFEADIILCAMRGYLRGPTGGKGSSVRANGRKYTANEKSMSIHGFMWPQAR